MGSTNANCFKDTETFVALSPAETGQVWRRPVRMLTCAVHVLSGRELQPCLELAWALGTASASAAQKIWSPDCATGQSGGWMMPLRVQALSSLRAIFSLGSPSAWYQDALIWTRHHCREDQDPRFCGFLGSEGVSPHSPQQTSPVIGGTTGKEAPHPSGPGA